MKRMLKHIKVYAIIAIFVLLFTTHTYAAVPQTAITPEEASQLAMFYYCINAENDDLIELDEYVATPLYSENGEIIYYSIDFFFEGKAKGYVVVGADLNYLQCPELNFDGTSIYYEKASNGLITIYYNPFEVFFSDAEETVFYDQVSEVPEDTVDGTVYNGNVQENSQLLQLVSEELDPITYRKVFAEHPVLFLQSLGYTSVTAGDYGTLESAMTSAGAFNPMYEIPTNSSYTVTSTGLKVYNGGHCSITAISNIMRYWKAMCLPNFPATYEQTFTAVFNKAVQLGYFSNTSNGGGVSTDHVEDLYEKISQSYGYTAYVDHRSGANADWDFLTESIDNAIPVYLTLTTNKRTGDTFKYNSHAVVAFGYNFVSGYRDDYYDEFSFVKFYDGHDSPSSTGNDDGKVYVCWQMLDYYLADNSDGAKISRHMFTLSPY